jgi:tricorn protease
MNSSCTGYKRFPSVSNDSIVFVSEDDLWKVSSDGGDAVRITTNAGEVSNPLFSPDGNWIAFSGQEEGQKDIYIIPSACGPNRRLTYLGNNTKVVAWSHDSKFIYFSSNANQPFLKKNEVYKLSVKGGHPEKLPFGNVNNLALGQNNGMVIGRNTADPARWKRYKGGTAGYLYIDKSGSGEFTKLVDLNGNIASPMWLRDNRIYFLSDHEGIGRIYSCKPDGSDLKCHTKNKEFYARNASSDGVNIVYHAGGEIYILNTHTGADTKLIINTGSSMLQRQRKFVDAGKFLEDYNISHDGKSISVITRGKSYAMPLLEGAVTSVSRVKDARYQFTQWLSDNKSMIYVTDRTSPASLEILSEDGTVSSFSSTSAGRVISVKSSPSGTKAAFSNHRFELLIADTSAKKIELIDRSAYERIESFSFSPDGRWLVYSKFETEFLASLFLYDCYKNEKHRLTETGFLDSNPVFDASGNFIFFLSQRDFNPVYDVSYFQLGFPVGNRPYAVALKRDTPSPFTPGYKDKFKELKKVKIEIEIEGITDRIAAFPLPEARYMQIDSVKYNLIFSYDNVKGALGNDTFDSGTPAESTLDRFDFTSQEIKKIASSVTSFKISYDRRSIVYRSGEKLFYREDILEEEDKHNHDDAVIKVTGTSKKEKNEIDLSRIKVEIDPASEWKQMYNEAWSLQKEHFWSEDMSGVDWELVRKRYLPVLAKVGSRSEFSDLIWELQGELGTSHSYEIGGDYRKPPDYKVGILGADFEFDEKNNGYKITRIIKGDVWKENTHSPLNDFAVNVSRGDIILEINGTKLDKEITPGSVLVNHAEGFVILTILSGGSKKTVTVKTLSDDNKARYRDWVEKNRDYVHKVSGGRLGYLHIPDMGPRGFSEFHRYYILEVERDGLVIDIRYNGGGHVSQLLLEKLSRKRYGYGLSRWGSPSSYPSHAVAGPMVAVTDENAGSDGDIFSHNFKQMKLGTLVGKRTWGGVVGISPRQRLADGSITTQPEYATWMSDVQWGVENYGTDPDIEVDYRPQDYAAGIDPQLDKAVSVAMEQLEKNPVIKPLFDNRPILKLPAIDD